MFTSTGGEGRCRQPRQRAALAVFRGIHDAVNTGDLEVISKTIDEVVEPNVLFYAPVPTGATRAQALKPCGRCSFARSRTRTSRWRIGSKRGTRSLTGTRSPGPPGRVGGLPPTGKSVTTKSI